MDWIFFLIGILLVGAAAAFVVRALVVQRLRTTEALGQISEYGYRGGAPGARPTSLRASVDRIASGLGNFFGARISSGREEILRNLLRSAGVYSTSPRMFMGYRALTTIAFPAAWIWLAAISNIPTIIVVLGFGLALAVGWVLPMTILRGKARRRLNDIEYELPELIDLLVVTVEAGMGLAGSLQLAGTRFGGPLGAELKLTIQEHSLGMSTNDALRNLLARADTPNMRSFVRSILQGEQLGVSIGQIMRNLAHEMRTRRRQLAEEKAQKAPIKMLFPLVFLIFPAMFVVLLAPGVFAFIDAIG